MPTRKNNCDDTNNPYKEETKKIKLLIKEVQRVALEIGATNNIETLTRQQETMLGSAHSAFRNAKRMWSQIPSVHRNQFCYDSLTKFEKHVLDLESMNEVIQFVQSQQIKSSQRKTKRNRNRVGSPQKVQLVNSDTPQDEEEEEADEEEREHRGIDPSLFQHLQSPIDSISEITVTLPTTTTTTTPTQETLQTKELPPPPPPPSAKRNATKETSLKTKSKQVQHLEQQNRHLQRKLELLQNVLWSRQLQ